MAKAASKTEMESREFRMRDSDFRTIADAIYTHAGIVIGDHKRELVYSRMARRLRQLGLANFETYLGRFDGPHGAEERDHLINALTTNHTHFFRESHHFEHVRDIAVKHWQARAAKTGDRRIRIWSAGCSSGEEPYSLAATLAEALGQGGGWDWRILATDIDTNVLAHAKRGEYPVGAVRDVPKTLQRNHFQPSARDGAMVRASAAIRSRITFNRLNLHGDWPMKGQFDLIFCRNVTIYFDGPTKNRLVKRFTESLKPDGWLYLGHSESVLGGTAGLHPVGRTIYSFKGEAR
ncbi:protein-glutamate O-methyltransferase CheR [Maricaulis sp.]|uniref:CheR family methyltransferase n=1 Tax=Maricaulis sp. TaxID=1486257 RepID=UPI0025BCA060|nr:protein-glutamate O-methyltransferase CheR [Maricaulis sp.]